MKSVVLPLLVMSCVPAFSGCQVLFHDDFEADTVGARPDLSPAGSPDGDEIEILPRDPGNLVVVADGLFGKSLVHIPRETVTQTFFSAVETRSDVEDYVAMWDGCADRFSPDTPRFFFSIGSLETGTANLEIRNGEFRASGESLARVVVGEVHTVRIAVDNEEGTYTVTLAQASPGSRDDAASCATAGGRRSACPEDFRFERGACRSGPNWLGHRAHCALEGPHSCAVCRDGEILDTMNGTCLSRATPRDRVTSSVRPLGRRVPSGGARIKIGMSYDNIAPSDPASYVIDDIWIFTPEE
jgi:hypothetical protein